jgi:predicted transcriptional regulator
MKSTLLLSVHPRFAEGILAGKKRVELRRRLPRLADTVVLYATSPTMALVGSFTVQSVVRLPLGLLWRQVRDVAGVTRAEYLNYFDGLTQGVGIFVGDTERFSRPLPLAELRALWPGFHPPQGFQYLGDETLDLLCSSADARSTSRAAAA